ncbi:uncharacterized protein pcare2 [Clarias gariepinus]|uniref:uncharacterized protein pcare2 n=1 Tax=Clarias gariepinus TaxID=13013 RepID=UPI00234C5EB1|nr:uncharacterized protein pcare2 [Clarias gariepinus]
MGCSPSKGQLFAGICNHQDKVLQFGSYECNGHDLPCGAEIKSQVEEDQEVSSRSLLQEENTAVPLQGTTPEVCDVEDTNSHPQDYLPTEKNTGGKDDRRKKNNGCKRRLRKTVHIQSNLDFSQGMEKAHQAAYAYLKHNIPKYESILGLLEKATETQLSLRSVVNLLSLQYEEINQSLTEIATEGEQMLEMHENHMALPEAENDVMLNPDIPEVEINSSVSSPDWPPHKLHHLIKKIRLVGDSVTELGDSSLGETGSYFGSLSQMLAGKLEVKRAAELRLKEVLACVESNALRKPNLEDSALHSEDSGISIENECHNGSVRCCSLQKSSGSRVNTQSSYECSDGNLLDQAYVNEDEDDDTDKDIDAEDNHDEEPKHEQEGKTDLTYRNMSNQSQAEPSQYPLIVNLQNMRPVVQFGWIDQNESNCIRQTQTADDLFISCQRKYRHLWGARRSRSADCLCRKVNDYMVQGLNRFPNDKPKHECMSKRQNPPQSCGPQDGNNVQSKSGLRPSLTSAFAPVPPGKNAVRRLINTFSQGVCDNSNPKSFNRFRGRKRSLLPVLNNCRALDVSDRSYAFDQQISERTDDVDMNSLPPPPPELLMDISLGENGPTGIDYASKTPNQGYSIRRQKCCVSQCPQSSIHTVSLYPSQDIVSTDSLNISETYHNGEDKSNPARDYEQAVGNKDKEKDEATGLFHHSQMTVHLCGSNNILSKLGPENEGNIKSLSERVEGSVRLGNKNSGDEASTHYSTSPLPTNPPASRVRITPSGYFTCHRISSSTAPSHSCPISGKGETFTTTFNSQIQGWTRKNSDDENGFRTIPSSMSFYNAHSMFCQKYKLASESVKPSCRSILPRPWGEQKVSRGRLQTTCLPQTFQRIIPYRPTLNDHQVLLPSVTETHYQDSEATTLNNGRKEYLTEISHLSKQDTPASCSVSGPQEAEVKITDKMD